MGKKIAIPIPTIVVGFTWLLNVMEALPGVDWMWTVGLAAVGILSMVVGGVNRLTIVIGPFLLVGSVCSLLRQTGRLTPDREIPILVMVLGVLMLVSQLSKLPESGVLLPEDEDGEK